MRFDFRAPMRSCLCAALAILAVASATRTWAQSGHSIFVDALVEGNATQPLPDAPVFRKAVQSIQERTHDGGPLVIRATRLQRFASQQRCGRVAFLIVQPSSGQVFPELGGALNLCEDGLPPLRECAERPGVLVPASARCIGGSAPHDTAEVASAIRASAVPRSAPALAPATVGALQ